MTDGGSQQALYYWEFLQHFPTSLVVGPLLAACTLAGFVHIVWPRKIVALGTLTVILGLGLAWQVFNRVLLVDAAGVMILRLLQQDSYTIEGLVPRTGLPREDLYWIMPLVQVRYPAIQCKPNNSSGDNLVIDVCSVPK